MKSIKSLLAIAGFSAALAFAGGVAAQSLSSVYIGGTIGQAEYKDGCAGVGDCDEKDTAWRILGGYQFNRYFAAELGYHNLGETSASAGATEGTAWELVGIASYPGLQYDFTKQIGVRGEWQRYNKMGGGAVAETDVDVLSVGVVYRFQ